MSMGIKNTRIERLSDCNGKFCMMGIGAVDALKEMISKRMGVPADRVGFQELYMFKKIIIFELASYLSAVSTDPVYGYPACVESFPDKTGLILSIQGTGYTKGGHGEMERVNEFLREWNDGEIWKYRFDALKLTIYYREEASHEVKQHQKSMAKDAGKKCAERSVPFILEVMSYPLMKEEVDNPLLYAKRLPEIVLGYVGEYSREIYGADILKIDFPADLKYCEEFAGRFGKTENILYTLSEIDGYCREVSDISNKPWVILSGGVGFDEFAERVKIACKAGASGFLGGRAIWGGAAEFFPDIEGMREWLLDVGVLRVKKLRNAVYNE
ncbi:MAG: tagatose 1,6-diphosphate aldolase [Spirochaetota bacterium]